MFKDAEIQESHAELTEATIPFVKLTDARRNRPAWADTTLKIINHIVGEQRLVRLKIATMYWQWNQTAQEIADTLGTSLGSVEQILFRLQRDIPPWQSTPES